MQALSDEMLKLKSASEHYEETKATLQKMCESVDKISQTQQKLADNISLAITEMEETNSENKKTQEFIQSLYDDAKRIFEAESQRHESAVNASVTEKFNEVRKQTERILQENADQSKLLCQINEEFGKQIGKIHQDNDDQAKRLSQLQDETKKIQEDNANQSKSMQLMKALLVMSVVMEALIVIRLFLF